jgi:hypothetical protein
MYRFIRTATVRNGALMPTALMFASQVTAHVNNRYGLNMRFGAEQYGSSKIHWHFDIDSLDKMQQANEKMLEDREYIALLQKFQDTWLEGSMHDAVVRLV